jgi:acyl-CoA hydrolase/GNAT superfamily N-acetyltransferase
MTDPLQGQPSRESWRDRAVTPEQALEGTASGDRIFIGTACATPRTLIAALEDASQPWSDLELVHFLTDGAVPIYNDKPFTRFRHRVFFVGSDTRETVKQGKIDYVPISVSQVRHLIDIGRIPIDLALIQVSPPDEDGMCSLGVSVDLIPAALRKATRVVAEINPAMPRTHGDSRIPLASIDRFVAVESPIIEYLHPPAEQRAKRIARYIARIIDDGSTLQIGLGRIPNEMLKYLDNRRDLGIHTDVITEPVVDLVEKGVVTGREKTVSPGRIVASYCMGTRRLYDFVDDNPVFELQPIESVCDRKTIESNHKMVSVTQAFAIDLTGQVCADQFEGELYGGVSSQPDFIRGAAASEGGKSIICLTSTAVNGESSRIKPALQEGEAVTIARSDVHFVVTEYGIAYLFGRSIRERALALIEIAHPDHREQLLDAAKQRGLLATGQHLKSRKAYPAEQERRATLKGGTEVLLRPTRATDESAMKDLFYNLTPEDIYTRFFTNLKSLTSERAQHLCSVDYEKEMAFAAVVGDWEEETIVGSGCFYVDPSTNLADVAYMIHPDWQGKGLGTVLQQRLMEYARGLGLRGFTADVLAENEKMLAVFEKSGCQVDAKTSSGVLEVTMLFPNSPVSSTQGA